MSTSAQSRLRKSFKYPSENSDEDDVPGDLDEEEQDHLIQTLAAKNKDSNKRYTTILLIIALFLTLPYLYTLLSPSFLPISHLTSVLAITSLVSTAYTVAYLPLNLPSPFATPTPTSSRQRAPLPSSPVELYLHPLNALLAILLAVIALKTSYDTNHPSKPIDTHGGMNVEWGVWMGVMPGVIFSVVHVARREMAAVQREVEGLGGLKYGLKGA